MDANQEAPQTQAATTTPMYPNRTCRKCKLEVDLRSGSYVKYSGENAFEQHSERFQVKAPTHLVEPENKYERHGPEVLTADEFNTLCHLASTTSGHAHGPRWERMTQGLIDHEFLTDEAQHVFALSSENERNAANVFVWDWWDIFDWDMTDQEDRPIEHPTQAEVRKGGSKARIEALYDLLVKGRRFE